MANVDESARTTECWRCGKQRYTYESCPHCGGSCKPLTKEKQQFAETDLKPGDSSGVDR